MFKNTYHTYSVFLIHKMFEVNHMMFIIKYVIFIIWPLRQVIHYHKSLYQLRLRIKHYRNVYSLKLYKVLVLKIMPINEQCTKCRHGDVCIEKSVRTSVNCAKVEQSQGPTPTGRYNALLRTCCIPKTSQQIGKTNLKR